MGVQCYILYVLDGELTLDEEFLLDLLDGKLGYLVGRRNLIRQLV